MLRNVCKLSIYLLALVPYLGFFLGGEAWAQSGMVSHRISVVVIPSISLDQPDEITAAEQVRRAEWLVPQILSRASDILQIGHPAHEGSELVDVACGVELGILPPTDVQTTATLPSRVVQLFDRERDLINECPAGNLARLDRITNKEDMACVLNVRQYLKLVSEIEASSCEANVKVGPQMTAGGCGRIGQPSMVIATQVTQHPILPDLQGLADEFEQLGILVAHEFGHTRGLPHHSDSKDFVMYGAETAGPALEMDLLSRFVTEDECRTFRSSTEQDNAEIQTNDDAGADD